MPVDRKRRRRRDAALRTLSRRLGRLRDWDLLRVSVGESPVLVEAIDRHRHQAIRRVGRRLTGQRFRTLAADLEAAVRRLPSSTEAEFRSLLVAALDHRWARFRQHLVRVDPADPEALHALRQQVRKLRQSSRWSAGWLVQPAPATFLRTLEQAQDLLGRSHDGEMQRGLLARLDEHGGLAPPAHDRVATRQIERCLQRLRALKAYWQP